MTSANMAVWSGRPYPLGATFDGQGVNFALFSENAELVKLCLFDEQTGAEVAQLPLPERTDGVWHGYLPNVSCGTCYGYRVFGRYQPELGRRFNPNKLLLDPYARDFLGAFHWDDSHFGYTIGNSAGDLSFDTRDNARFLPKCCVASDDFDWRGDRQPGTPWQDTVIYELHVRGFTKLHPHVPERLRGTYLGLASPAVIDHLRFLGVSAVELMPVHTFLDERHLVNKGLRNYWGYNSIGFFAPDRRYVVNSAVREFKTMVRALHAAGIEVILDVVYNHTAEGNHLGPTLSLRGIDNSAYYRLVTGRPRYYMDYTGCGNTLNVMHPRVLQLIMDSLRYWVLEMHVDGFRFDLAAALARESHAVDRLGAFFDVIRQDPVLSQVKLIAEPWDLGEGGYQLGNFPSGWSEWNGKYRDAIRRFWKSDEGQIPQLACRLTGSSDLYQHNGRSPCASINFITSHDGFTLEDLVSYSAKHNERNLENNADGDNESRSWNCGVEGLTSDPLVASMRLKQKKNMLATLLFSHGVPMLSAGDEFGRTQHGNNNAYCQDNELSWLSWNLGPEAEHLLCFVRDLINLRRTHPIFRRRQFTGALTLGAKDPMLWLKPNGVCMNAADWRARFARCFGLMLVGENFYERDHFGQPLTDDTFLLLLNAYWEPIRFILPDTPGTVGWRVLVDTSRPPEVLSGKLHPPKHGYEIPGRTLLLLVRDSEHAAQRVRSSYSTRKTSAHHGRWQVN